MKQDLGNSREEAVANITTALEDRRSVERTTRIIAALADDATKIMQQLPIGQLPGSGTVQVLAPEIALAALRHSTWGRRTLSPLARSGLGTWPGMITPDEVYQVFFAGRAKDLEMFIGALGARGCGNPVTVISGDDDLIDASTTTAADYNDYLHALSTGNITLYSTALAHPDEWTPAICGPTPPSQADAARTFSQFTKDYARLLGHLALPLNLGNAMLARDAVITAVMTIRGPVQQTAGVQQPYRSWPTSRSRAAALTAGR